MASVPSAEFAVNIGGNFADGALSNVEAAEKLADAMDQDMASLKAMQGALRNLSAGHMGATKDAKALREQIAAQKVVLAQNQVQALKLGTTVVAQARAAKQAREVEAKAQLVAQKAAQQAATQAAKEAKAQLVAQQAAQRTAQQATKTVALEARKLSAQHFQVFRDQLMASNTAVGSMTSSAVRLTSVLGKGGVAGAVGLAVVALLAVASATGIAVGALGKYALGVLDARRAEMIRLEGLTKLPNWFGVAAGKATDMQAAIDRVSQKVALGRDRIVAYAESLYRMGLRGKNLDVTLQATATRASVLGEEMGNAYASMAMGAALTGRSLKAMADLTERRFGALARKQMLSFTVQIQKARENFDALFRGVRIEGFLSRFAVLTEMFSQSTATGRALKVMLETLLNPLFGSADHGAPILKRFFQGIVIGALYAGIGVLRLRNWFRTTFGGMGKDWDLANKAVYAGIAVVGIFTAQLVVLTAAVTALGVALGIVFAVNIAAAGIVVGALAAIGYGFYKLYTWADKARKWLGMGWGEVGVAILAGLLNPFSTLFTVGLKLGKKMLEGFKQAWEIKSPSRVAFRLVSHDIAGGGQRGAESAGPRVGVSVGRMFMPRDPGPSAGGRGYTEAGGGAAFGGRLGASGGEGKRISIDQLHVHTSGGGNPRKDAYELYQELCSLFEAEELSVGGAF
jgi:hypothetical protein